MSLIRKMARLIQQDMQIKRKAELEVDVFNFNDYKEAVSYKEENEYDWKQAYWTIYRLAGVNDAWKDIAWDIKAKMHYYTEKPYKSKHNVSHPDVAWGSRRSNDIERAKRIQQDIQNGKEKMEDLSQYDYDLVDSLRSKSFLKDTWERLPEYFNNIDWS